MECKFNGAKGQREVVKFENSIVTQCDELCHIGAIMEQNGQFEL